MDIKTYLEQMVELRGNQFPSIESFVLKHGRTFKATAETFKGRRMAQQQCFYNATRYVFKNSDCFYVEGYMRYFVPIHHAWVLRKDGVIIDPTLRVKGRTNPVDEYFGVVFSTDFVKETLYNSKYFGIINGLNPNIVELVKDELDFAPTN